MTLEPTSRPGDGPASSPTASPSARARVLDGGGEMGALMRSIDWSQTAVGEVHGWPQSLRTALSILLETGFPMYIAWGKDFTQFYNDGYRPILGSTKHPQAMGRSTRETFAEIWDIIGPMFDGVMAGTPTTLVDFLLPLDRHGFVEECYFIFSYSPIREEGGNVGGVLVTVTETTKRVLGERRLQTSQALAAKTRAAHDVIEVCEIAAGVLGENPADVPALRIYLLAADKAQCALVAACGDKLDLPDGLELTGDGAQPFLRALHSGECQRLDSNGSAERVILPITQPGAQEPCGVLVADTSARLVFDDDYQSFLALVAAQIGSAVAGAQALTNARERAEELAQLDRAKTAFFNNVSHEFRTPLTLMLGPTQDALASQDRALSGADLETVHRNELRLLKLVNTLLDFSRIEAGRVEAHYEPTDLVMLTRDLASAFRSAMQRAGLELELDLPTLPEPIYVDREMWEKIISNLLSNALKFTFHGKVTVSASYQGSYVEVFVSDTGVGIARADLEHIFERFHRVQAAKARTHEGSGIGLALVRELVAMHGGEIHATSEIDRGTTFRITLPTGCAHLPSERIGQPRVAGSTATGASAYVEEALRWLPATAKPSDDAAAPTDGVRVLVADDNADMRDYITRLLGVRWTVEAVSDGQAALDAARRSRPDIVISDVMMPGLDGFELLAALRADDATRSIPVVLLSARAGEEAQIDGLNAGADDYLVKPFSARELMARVEAQIVRAKVRSVEEAHATRLASVFGNAPVGVAILRGSDHVFEYANKQYLRLVGERAVVGKPVRDALPEVVPQGIIALLDGVYRSGRPYIGRALRLLLDEPEGSREVFFDFVYQPLLEGDVVTGIAVVAFDVTDLTTARRAAESASRAKDEFLAMLGHELRNPLAPILTALQLMRLRGITGVDRERTVIERQVKHMVSLVDDLLDVSRITRGKVQLKHEQVDLADVVAKAIEMTSPAIEERRHLLDVDVPRGLVIEGDAPRLAQVVANLLTNAAKYTDANGRIALTATEENGAAVLRVIDNGRGIAPEMSARIFDLFSQERQEIDRSQGGLGLGLAIVRSLVQAHGGSVSVRSGGKGLGSEFSVRLPLSAERRHVRPVTEPGPLQSAPGSGSLKVLIVDDNQDAAELLSASLTVAGHRTAVAFDGPEALQTAEHFRPDVALLDLGLAVMDGFEVARRLRAIPTLAGIGTVAITGYGQPADRRRTEEAGFDAHFVKPVDFAELESWLQARQVPSQQSA